MLHSLGKVPNLLSVRSANRQSIGKARVRIGGDGAPEFILPFVESEVCVPARVSRRRSTVVNPRIEKESDPELKANSRERSAQDKRFILTAFGLYLPLDMRGPEPSTCCLPSLDRSLQASHLASEALSSHKCLSQGPIREESGQLSRLFLCCSRQRKSGSAVASRSEAALLSTLSLLAGP